MSKVTAGPELLDWQGYTDILAQAEKLLAKAPKAQTPEGQQQFYRLLFSALASGYHSAFADPRYPDFVPVVSNILNSIGANPDFIYGYTQLDGEGCYRIAGQRGDEVFVLIDFTAGGLGVLDEFGPAVGYVDVDTLKLDDDGNFELLLCAEWPEGYQGDWFALKPNTKTAGIRKAYYQWGEGRETRITIERLDTPPRAEPLTAEETARRLTKLSEYVMRYAGFILGYGQRQREQGFVNKLEYDDWAGRGGVDGQHYYQGIFELQPDEVMIIETELPKTVRYWNIQVNDALWNTIDWFNHQSSINGSQAVIDSDGRFRAVIAAEDPGVANWLDTAGHLTGSLMLRWTEASSGPKPEVKIVKLAELKKRLPTSTAWLSEEQREAALRKRHRAAQWRRRW